RRGSSLNESAALRRRYPMIMYKIGDRGPQVARLQAMLNKQATTEPTLTEDGEFGPLTQDAVQSFQTMTHQSADGVVLDDTWRALERQSQSQESLGDAFWL